MITLLLTCAMSALVTYFYWWKRRRLIMLARRLPGPPTLPIIGNILDFRSADLSENFKTYINLLKRYGDVVRIWFGPQLVVALQDPDHIEKITGREKYGYRGKYVESTIEPAFFNSLFGNTGEKWKKRRKIISTGFQNNVLMKFVKKFSLYSNQLADRMSKMADGKHIDIYPYVLLSTMDIICETGFGHKMNAQLNNDFKIVESLLGILELLTMRFKNPLLKFNIIYKLSGVKDKFQPHIDHLHNVIRDNLGRRIEELKELTAAGNISIEKIKNPFVMDALLLSGTVCLEDILGEVTTFAGAGAETTATTSCYLLALLCEHPDIQDKVVQEQRDIFGSDFLRPVTTDDLQQMTYLEQTIKETLRLFPTVPILFRDIAQDIDIGGHIIPAGTLAMLTNYCLHKNPKYFSNPDSFDPEHFSSENCIGRHPYAYFPFGLGRRLCIGHQYAMMEMKTVLSTLLRRFHFSSVKGGVIGLEKNAEFGLVLTNKEGFNISFVPRD